MSERIYVFKRFERFWHWSQAALIIFLMLTAFDIHGTLSIFGFEKAVAYHTSRGVPGEELSDRCRRTLDRVRDNGFEHYHDKQRAWLETFWRDADVEVEGQPHIQQAVRWCLFQLAQANSGEKWRRIQSLIAVSAERTAAPCHRLRITAASSTTSEVKKTGRLSGCFGDAGKSTSDRTRCGGRT